MPRKVETKTIDTETGEVLAKHEHLEDQNKDFVQLYRAHIQDIGRLGQQDPLALAVWLFIVERMGRDNALVCSMTPIVEHFNKSRQTISGKIAKLQKAGFLQIAKAGTTNIYMINAEIVWTTSASGKKYAEFRGQIMISKSEQEQRQMAVNKSSESVDEMSDVKADEKPKSKPQRKARSRKVMS